MLYSAGFSSGGFSTFAWGGQDQNLAPCPEKNCAAGAKFFRFLHINPPKNCFLTGFGPLYNENP